MVTIEEIPIERADEFLEMQFKYLVDDKMLENEEEKAYFSGNEYRSHLKRLMQRSPDKLYMVYFIRDGVRIGAAHYCTYHSEDGKCFILDFWVFPEYRGNGTGHACFDVLVSHTRSAGAVYYALNYSKENSHRFWLSNGFTDAGEDEYGSKLMIKK